MKKDLSKCCGAEILESFNNHESPNTIKGIAIPAKTPFFQCFGCGTVILHDVEKTETAYVCKRCGEAHGDGDGFIGKPCHPGAPKEPTGEKCPVPHCNRTDPLPHRHDFIDDARKANHKFCDNCGGYYIEPKGKHICPKSAPKKKLQEAAEKVSERFGRAIERLGEEITIEGIVKELITTLEYGVDREGAVDENVWRNQLTSKLELIEKEAYERGCEDEAERQGFQVVEREKIALAQGRAEMQAICIAAVKKLKTAQLQPQPLGPDQIMRDALVNQVVYRLQSLQ